MHALVGCSGFVGSSLSRQHNFLAQFNSRNVAAASGKLFDTVVCAAAPGSMLEANRLPERDKAAIDKLIEALSRLNAKQFVLVSSIAVLHDLGGHCDESTTRFQEALPYGTHRRFLETFCAAHFPRCLIVRLPALFGPGLKKNFIFDVMNPTPSFLPPARLDQLLQALSPSLATLVRELYRWHDVLRMFEIDRAALKASGRRLDIEEAVVAAGFSAVRFTSPAARFQYYDMSRLWADICIAVQQRLPVVHFAPEPVAAQDVYHRLTGAMMEQNTASARAEDFRTRYAGLWERTGPYLDDAASVLSAVKRFFDAEKSKP